VDTAGDPEMVGEVAVARAGLAPHRRDDLRLG
jgi:hypothetical protein